MKLNPLSDRVVVKPQAAEEKTASGIILPDTAKEKPQQGNIVAVGPGRLNDDGDRVSMEVKVGDRVLYGKYAGTEVALEGADYLIVKESDILAVL